MILTLIASISISAVHGDKPLSCPMMGGPANVKGTYSDYNGVRVYYCCPGCDAQFESNPKKASDEAAKKGMVWGTFLFDPVSGNRLKPEKAIKETSEYNGVRFSFESAEDKAKFDADPKKYGTLPEKEALYCPAMKQVVKNYGRASGFVDYNGVRYYMCCAGCEASFAKDAESMAALGKDYVKAPGVATQKPDKVGG